MRRAVQAVKAGREPEWRVPAAKSRRRLERLRAAGLSVPAIAELSGVGYGTLKHLVRRDRNHVTVTTEARLEACRP
jgi:IS30 family transposase